ncbi:MAG: DNA topoisomerase I [Rhodanobacteraceae bacterium]|nr:DNA topoisomerase I [Rhodanobacteraceae bacterium]
MAKNLLIVESPAKVKTINKVLGKDFQVMASYGHVRDLPSKDGSVDTEHDFHMAYEVIDRNEKHVDAIAKAARAADSIYLATDLDREGEAISWHVYEILREKKLLANKDIHRVTFAEITPKAIKEAIAHPRELSLDLINAQQARRALDYLVGFNLSPLLWKKVQRGLSAGRVQSPALRMIVEREEEIERFIPREYWTIEADCFAGQAFTAKLSQLGGKKVDQFDLNDEAKATAARERVLAGAKAHKPKGALKVADIQRKDRQRRAAPPFITSTLQQEAARKLGFGTQRTMRIAQGLYEGVDVGEGGQIGLITYMRTDSVHLSNDALAELRHAIEREFGADKLPPGPQFYKTKSKNAQEAHEAIRPTSALRTPASIAKYLTPDQLKLYELIWKRTLACQMKPALLNTVSVDLEAGKGDILRASGTTVVDPGFLAVYEEGRDQKNEDDEAGAKLPPMEVGQLVDLNELRAEQHFTEPPPRFSEASLVKALEEYGIGRPSTYASIIQVLLAREYVTLEQRRFQPTDVGRVVAKFLAGHFNQYVDYEFTARLEDELDAVARGEKDWVPVLREFWVPFKAQVEEKDSSVTRAEVTQGRVLGLDPKTGKEISVRLGRFGPFVQIGTKDDEDKPRFASLRAGQKMDSITLPEALKLFELPRQLGKNAEGEEISVGIGRFGPFVKAGSTYASIPAGTDPYEIDLDAAVELVRAKREALANRVIASFQDGAIQILRGKFGPYITDGSKNGKIPKDVAPEDLSEADCVAILAAAPAKAAGKGRFGRKGGKPEAPKKTRTVKAKAEPAAGDKPAPKKKASAKKASAKKPAAKKSSAAKTTTRKAKAPALKRA